MRLFFFIAVLAASSFAQPFVFYRGVVNSASFMPPGLPGSGIARGSIFTIFGRNLGPAQPVTAEFPLQAALGGASIEVCVGANCVAALPLFVSATQINAIMPSNAPLGRVSLRVRAANQIGNWSPIVVVGASVGLYSVNSGGFGPAIVQNYLSPSEAPLNSLSVPAYPGQVLVVYGTGLGSNLGADNQPAPVGQLPTPVEVFLGEKLIRAAYSGRAPGFAGLDQFNIQIPTDAPTGCYVPLRIRTGGVVVSNTVTIAIQPEERMTASARCQDGHNSMSGPLSLGSRVGAIFASRVEIDADVPAEARASYITERGYATFLEPSPSNFYFNGLSLPAPGSCLALTVRGDAVNGSALPPLSNGPTLDAGAKIRFAAGGRSLEVPKAPSLMAYAQRFVTAVSTAASFAFGSGRVGINIDGGRDLSSLNVDLDTVAPLAWTNRASIRIVDRTKALRIDFTGASEGQDLVLIGGLASAPLVGASGAFLCVAQASAGTFLVPEHVLANFPETPSIRYQFNGVVALGRISNRTQTINFTGLDFLSAAFANWQANTVSFR